MKMIKDFKKELSSALKTGTPIQSLKYTDQKKTVLNQKHSIVPDVKVVK